MIDRLFVIGDSFTVPCRYSKGWDDSVFWIEKLGEFFNLTNDRIFVDGIANRDIQTIIDNWIKLIPHLTDMDRVVICLPYFKRVRLPLKESHWYEPYKPYPKDIKIVNRFIGPQMLNTDMSLEFWDKDLEYDEISKMMQPQEIINSTYSAQLNQIEVVESLVKITPCKSFVFTWDEMENKSKSIMDKESIIREIGFWQTLNDEWIETNGKIGKELDFHWGSKFNPIFGEYVFGRLKNLSYI